MQYLGKCSYVSSTKFLKDLRPSNKLNIHLCSSQCLSPTYVHGGYMENTPALLPGWVILRNYSTKDYPFSYRYEIQESKYGICLNLYKSAKFDIPLKVLKLNRLVLQNNVFFDLSSVPQP